MKNHWMASRDAKKYPSQRGIWAVLAKLPTGMSGQLLAVAESAYSFGPAALMASETSNFLKFSMNSLARPWAASS
jgi:hypothetical protein